MAEPIRHTLRMVAERAAFEPYWVGISRETARDMLAHIRALEAEVARKDEALKPFALFFDACDFERVEETLFVISKQRHLDAKTFGITVADLHRARAALGPWVPTHRHENGTLAREVVRAQFGVGADIIPVVILDDVFHRPFVVAAEKVERDFRPLTPDEARVAMEGRS